MGPRGEFRERRTAYADRKCNHRVPALASIESWSSVGRLPARAKAQLAWAVVPDSNPAGRNAKASFENSAGKIRMESEAVFHLSRRCLLAR